MGAGGQRFERSRLFDMESLSCRDSPQTPRKTGHSTTNEPPNAATDGVHISGYMYSLKRK